MARVIRQPFHANGQYVARKGFTYAGVEFQPGDTFDPELHDCPEDKMRKLFEARFIMAAEKKAKEKVEKAPENKIKEQKTDKKGGKKKAA